MPKRKRNYKQEARYQARPEQKKRRAQRNKARRAAVRKYGKSALRGKEVHHVGSNRRGSLSRVKTRVVSRGYNRRRQPKRKARGRSRDPYG